MNEATRGRVADRLLAIRPVTPGDLPALKAVIDANGRFPSDMLDGMTAGYFNGDAEGDGWLPVDDGAPMAVAYFAPERMAAGTWNLLLIAVHPDRQGEGCGAALLGHLEQALAARGRAPAAGGNLGASGIRAHAGVLSQERLWRGSPDPRLLPAGRGQDHLSQGPSLKNSPGCVPRLASAP